MALEDGASAWEVRLADAAFNARRYLVLRRARAPSADDIEFGLDGYCAEVSHPAHAAHGGIARCELHRDRIVVEFDAAMVGAFGGVAGLEATFALGERPFAALRDRLARVFAGEDCYRDCAP